MTEEIAQSMPGASRLTELLEPVVVDFGFELADLQFRREASGLMLRLILDGENGVSIDDCSRISREVSHLLEVEDPIDQPFCLEVSSPGLDRPLKREKDFIRCLGKKAKVVVHGSLDDQSVFIGRIDSFDQGIITMALDQKEVRIPFSQVKRARLVIDF